MPRVNFCPFLESGDFSGLPSIFLRQHLSSTPPFSGSRRPFPARRRLFPGKRRGYFFWLSTDFCRVAESFSNSLSPFPKSTSPSSGLVETCFGSTVNFSQASTFYGLRGDFTSSGPIVTFFMVEADFLWLGDYYLRFLPIWNFRLTLTTLPSSTKT